MDTKLKKSRPFLSWLCFFLGFNMLIFLAISVVRQSWTIDSIGDISASFRSDMKDMSAFKEEMADRFQQLLRIVDEKTLDDTSHSHIASFRDAGVNILFYAENRKTGKIFTNTKAEDIFSGDSVKLPQGYDYYLHFDGYFDGTPFSVMKGGKAIDVGRAASGYPATALNQYLNGDVSAYRDIRIVLIVRKDIVRIDYTDDTLGQLVIKGGEPVTVRTSYYSNSLIELQYRMNHIRLMNTGYGSALLICLALLTTGVIKRKKKREFDKKLAGLLGAVWLEIKAVLTLLAFGMQFWAREGRINFFYSVNFRFGSGSGSRTFGLSSNAATGDVLEFILIAALFWWLYLLALDMMVNKRSFLKNTFINWSIERYHAFERKKPFQKAMLLRLYALIAAEAALAALSLIAAYETSHGAPFGAPFIFILIGAYLLYRYARRYKRTVSDMGEIVDGVEAVKNGAISVRLKMSEDSDLQMAGMNLLQIGEGMQKALDERLRSERMKVELITNVSHDLKTPLTSIISYTDLLSKEEDLPDHAKEYVRILAEKSNRLKGLIQDLFDLSKASSGELDIRMEDIDLGKLIRQTMADMSEQIEQSDLSFKTSIPEEPTMITSDGMKLYRVFQNLFSNVLKYSMKGSRVYIDLDRTGEAVTVSIKNISNYEMNFDAEEVTERFVRGDKSRSTEGSGLGLAIARSFTAACGGSFDIKIDGDLFKVCLAFKTASKSSQTA